MVACVWPTCLPHRLVCREIVGMDPWIDRTKKIWNQNCSLSNFCILERRPLLMSRLMTDGMDMSGMMSYLFAEGRASVSLRRKFDFAATTSCFYVISKVVFFFEKINNNKSYQKFICKRNFFFSFIFRHLMQNSYWVLNADNVKQKYLTMRIDSSQVQFNYWSVEPSSSLRFCRTKQKFLFSYMRHLVYIFNFSTCKKKSSIEQVFLYYPENQQTECIALVAMHDFKNSWLHLSINVGICILQDAQIFVMIFYCLFKSTKAMTSKFGTLSVTMTLSSISKTRTRHWRRIRAFLLF